MNWKDVVGRRVLIKEIPLGFTVFEVKVLEVSPSGRYVKLSNGKRIWWERSDRYVIVEVLNDKDPYMSRISKMYGGTE